MGCNFLPQGIIPTQGLNPGLPRCRQMLYHLSHQGRVLTGTTVQKHQFYVSRLYGSTLTFVGLPCGSAGKESACNAGGPGSIPGVGRSAGEGIGYPLQYSWASMVAHTVKNLPTIWETLVQSLGWEDLLEKGMATHSCILVWRISWTEEPGRLQSMRSQRVEHN